MTLKHLEAIEGDNPDLNVIINAFSDDLRLAVLTFLHSFINEGIEEIKLQDGKSLLKRNPEYK